MKILLSTALALFVATPALAMDPVPQHCYELDLELDAAARKKVDAMAGGATLSLDFAINGKTFRLKPVNLPEAGQKTRTGDDCALVPEKAKLTLAPRLEKMELVEGKPKFSPFPGVTCAALEFESLAKLKAAKMPLLATCKG